MHTCMSLMGDSLYLCSLVVMSSSLSLPPQLSCGGLDKVDVVVVSLEGGHDGHLVEGLGVVDGGGEDDPLPGGDVLSLSLPPQSSCGGPDGGDNVVVPLDGGHDDHLGAASAWLLVAARMTTKPSFYFCFESERS